MNDTPYMFSQAGAVAFSSALWTLYSELSRKFGDERAWELIVSMYKGSL